jgi:hypothetical protein
MQHYEMKRGRKRAVADICIFARDGDAAAARTPKVPPIA